RPRRADGARRVSTAGGGPPSCLHGSAKPLLRLAALGFETIQLGSPASPTADVPPAQTDVQALTEPDQQHEEDVVRDAYAAPAPQRRCPLYVEMFRTWRPDVVVRDEVDFGSSIVAQAMGIPRAVVVVIGA